MPKWAREEGKGGLQAPSSKMKENIKKSLARMELELESESELVPELELELESESELGLVLASCDLKY
eukprot:SAG31_NODE_1571_length_7851_cov_8.714525_12_plen_67_part_00